MRILLLLATALVACTDSTGLDSARPVDNVLIRIDVPGRCLVGGCDPVSTDRNILGLVTILNMGTATAYVRSCGTIPLLTEQHLEGGVWVTQVTTITGVCTSPPNPSMAFAPGDSVQLNYFFPHTPTRLVVDVATNADLSDERLDASAGVGVP